ncbi:MAG: transglycosylase domain-containing protein [Bacilli bacterium]
MKDFKKSFNKTRKDKKEENKKSRLKKVRRRKINWKKIITILFGITCIVSLIGIIVLIFFANYIVKNAPEFDPENLFTMESSIVYDKDGNIAATLGTEKREKVSFEELPETLVNAIIATEDSNFFKHSGLDIKRFLSASVGQLLGKNAGGASTLPMQITKLQYTNRKETIVRKFTDIYLSVFEFERKYSKEEIFEYYVNIPYLCSGTYGVQAASLMYFGKDVSQLTLPEAATIAGLFQSPDAYDPYKNPKRAEARRSTVLYLMEKHGYITSNERKLANSIPVESLLVGKKTAEKNDIQGYIDTVVAEVKDKTGKNPYTTPMLIYTALDQKLQVQVNNALDNLKLKDDIVQIAAGIVHSETGSMPAIYAGRNREGASTYNFATDINRQPGSTAKPLFDYGPAIEYNNYSTYTMVKDEPYTYSDGTPIGNWDSKYFGNMTLRQALVQSRNIPALKTFQQVNSKNIEKFVKDLGIKPESPLHESHSIGGFNGTNPIELAGAYAAFSNGGYFTEPYTVKKIEYRNTGVVEELIPPTVKAMSSSTAFMITDILQGISGPRLSGIQIASKTGTTNLDSKTKRKLGLPNNAIPDLWYVSYSPEYSISIWYGYEQLSKEHYLTTANWPDRKRIINAVGNVVFKGNKKTFKTPSTVQKIGVELGTTPAMLPSSDTPNDKIVYEWFKTGTGPTETSTSYEKADDVTNLTSSLENKTVKLNWNYTNDVNVNLGDPIYNIYKNDVLLDSISNKSYTTTLKDGETSAIFTVKVSFTKALEKVSKGVSITVTIDSPIDPVENVTVNLTTNNLITVVIGSTYTEPTKPIIIKKGTTDITNSPDVKITKKIINMNTGNAVGTINTETQAEFKITYTITYDKKVYTLEKIIKIIAS